MKLVPDINLSEGRGLAYTGMIVGIMLSVAGNLGHAYVPPKDAPPTWTPKDGVVFSAAMWPIILFLMYEIMVSVRWPKDWYFYAIRWGVVGGVASIAGVASYQHMSSLLKYWGETSFVWHAGPLAVDGLLIMSSTALIVIRMNLAPTNDAPDETPVPVAPINHLTPLPTTPTQRRVPDVPVPVPTPVPPSNGNGSQTGNAKLIFDALPGTVAKLVETTGVKRTTVDYALKKTLADSVHQDADGIWHRKTTDA